MALRQRLEGVAGISISQSRQTVEVTFSAGEHLFSPAAFHEAVDEAGVTVVEFQIDACGAVEQTSGGRLLIAGPNRFLLSGGRAASSGTTVCVSGRLEERSGHRVLHVSDLQVVTGGI